MNAADLFQPKELTRGNVKAAMKGAAATSSDLWQVPLDQIKFIDGFNGRVETPDYLAHIDLIAQSIIENGFFQDKPIAGFVAEEDGQQVIYATEGHTRVRAARLAVSDHGVELATLPMVIKQKGTTLEDLTIAMVKSNEGRPFTPYETSLICKRLVDMGMPEKTIVKRLGITGQYLSDLMTLVGAPKAIRDAVVEGSVSATVATKIVKDHGSKAVQVLKESMSIAKAAGKEKVTAKHVAAKRPTLKLVGVIRTDTATGATQVVVTLNGPLDVMLTKGDKVRLVISESDDAL